MATQTKSMPESELGRMTNVEIADAVTAKKLDASVAGAFLLGRFTRKSARKASKAASQTQV